MSNEIMKKNTSLAPVDQMKGLLNGELKGMFYNALQKNAKPFMASLIDLYSGDNSLKRCDPRIVAMEALKAATLNLPINKTLGFAYIVPYKNIPTFTIGYKGYVQLAMRTGQYKSLNAGFLYEGMELKHDYLSGTFDISGEPISDKIIGYFAYFKLINGFEKALYMSKEEVEKYGKKYSKTYNSSYSPWKSEFDEMAKKTVMRRLLSKYGVLSIEMEKAIKEEEDIKVSSRAIENGAITLNAIEPPHEIIEIDGSQVDLDTGEIVDTTVKPPF